MEWVAKDVRLGDARPRPPRTTTGRPTSHPASYVHGTGRNCPSWDVSGRAHLEQPLADRQVATSPWHGREPSSFVSMSPAAPTSNNHWHTDRWPPRGPCMSAASYSFGMSPPRPPGTTLADRQVATLQPLCMGVSPPSVVW